MSFIILSFKPEKLFYLLFAIFDTILLFDQI